MKITLLDLPDIRQNLLPLTFTRPIADIRVGILRISEKWEARLNAKASYTTESYLAQKFPASDQTDLLINAAVCPDAKLVDEIKSLKDGDVIYHESTFIAAKSNRQHYYGDAISTAFNKVAYQSEIVTINHSWDIFSNNGQEIKKDFALLTQGRKSQDIVDPHTIIYGSENVFIEEGAKLKACILNAERGPIYIGKNSQIHEGAIITGPFAIGESAHVNAGAKIKADTTIGPHCKVGGEVSNAVFFAYSNKGHDGYLGNAVIGEWCNLGADTNNSNLKNNYTSVKVWDYNSERFKDTGLQFCGLIMGDHAKCAINTMFNTGTVVGVAANVFGAGFPKNFLPSFSWGGVGKTVTFAYHRALETA
ncbi:MAG: UDP-N-acetylglucosamine diphosphorylase/glucosamine-1-phosphate N-acetyltransferase, partial [Parvicellaceae bacterium]